MTELPPKRLLQRWTLADWLTVLRLPLAAAFPLTSDLLWRGVILAAAAASDLLDGWIARRIGSSRFGVFLDPVVDKLFMASAFGVVLVSGTLQWYEILAVLARDIVAAVAFAVVAVRRHAASIPARAGGKAVTLGQSLTLVAFLLESPLLRPMAWATGAVALYAIWDYQRVAAREARAWGGGGWGVGGRGETGLSFPRLSTHDARPMTTDPNVRSITLQWQSGMRFEGGPEGGPSTIVDADVVAAPGPMHLLLVAIAGCSGADVVSILKKMQVTLRRCDIKVTGRRAPDHPKRYQTVQLEFTLAGDGLDEAKGRRAIELSIEKYCSVIHSLNPDIPVTYGLTLAH